LSVANWHVNVRDDGRGFDAGAPTDRFGISGMRDRVALLHGDLEVESSFQGASVPTRPRGARPRRACCG
jgi:signal transduction histidine kinase